MSVDRYDGIDKDPEGAFVYYQDYREIEAICEGLDSYASVCVANVQRLESRINVLEDALSNLVNALDMVHNDPEYMAVWTLYSSHVLSVYRGRKYTKQLDDARKALEVKP